MKTREAEPSSSLDDLLGLSCISYLRDRGEVRRDRGQMRRDQEAINRPAAARVAAWGGGGYMKMVAVGLSGTGEGGERRQGW